MIIFHHCSKGMFILKHQILFNIFSNKTNQCYFLLCVGIHQCSSSYISAFCKRHRRSISHRYHNSFPYKNTLFKYNIQYLYSYLYRRSFKIVETAATTPESFNHIDLLTVVGSKCPLASHVQVLQFSCTVRPTLMQFPLKS